MKQLLTDIALDIRQLECVVQAWTAGADEALRDVALRSIGQMQARLDELRARLEASTAAPTTTPTAAPTATPTVAPTVASIYNKVDNDACQTNEKTGPWSTMPSAQPTGHVPTERVPAEHPTADHTTAEHIPTGHASTERTLAERTLAEHAPAERILAESIRPARDLRHAISLAERFRLTRELFGGDSARTAEAIGRLSEAGSLDEALGLLARLTPTAEDNPAYADLVDLLGKYFT